MVDQLQFQEDEFANQRISLVKKPPKLLAMVMSTGLAKNQKQAGIILLVAVVILIFFAFLLLRSSDNNTFISPDDPALRDPYLNI